MFVFQGTQDRVWMSARKLKSQVQMTTFAELECIESNSPVLMTDGLTKPTRVRSKLNSNLNFAASSNEKVTTTDGNTIAIPDLKKVLEQIPKNTDMIRFAIMSRKPALSDPLSLRDHRSVQDVSAGAFSESNGGLSNLLSDKKKDKEYSFTAFESEDDEKPVGRWEVGAGFAPDMAFASTTPVAYPLLASDFASQSSFLEIKGLPLTLVIARDGHVEMVHLGPLDEAMLEPVLERLIGK